MADGDFRNAALVGRGIRTTDYLFGADPAQSDLAQGGRSDLVSEFIATVFQNVAGVTLTTSQRDAITNLLAITDLIRAQVQDPAETGNADRWSLAKMHGDTVHSITLSGTEITVNQADGTHYTIHLPPSGGTGLAAVSRDNTLEGDGTSANPLSVAAAQLAPALDAEIGTTWRTGGSADGVLNGASFDTTTYMASLARTVGAAVTLDLSPILTRIEALEAHFGPMPQHTAYLGWSADRTITASDFSGALESDNHQWTIPAGGPGYLWYAVTTTDGEPVHETVDGFTQPANAFTQVGQASFMGTAYLIFATAQQLSASAEGRRFVLQYSP